MRHIRCQSSVALPCQAHLARSFRQVGGVVSQIRESEQRGLPNRPMPLPKERILKRDARPIS